MARSMTAYGRGMKSTPAGRWVVELHSVNRKTLDISLVMPKDLLCFDLELRKQIGAEIVRGQVTVRVAYEPEELFAPSTLKKLTQAKKSWEKVAVQLGYVKNVVDLPFLLSHALRDVAAVEDEKTLGDAVAEALRKLVVMKLREGEHLVKDLTARLKNIEQLVKKVEKLSPQMKESLVKKLRESAQGLFPLTKENEERFLRELAVFAEKSDVTEEITRLYSHIEQFRDLIASKERSIGRSLDFLAQEMHREMNTIASKAADSAVSKISIEMRAECEKIREQVQNIE